MSFADRATLTPTRLGVAPDNVTLNALKLVMLGEIYLPPSLLGLFSVLLPLLQGGCTTALIVAHAHAQITEGDPAPCIRLNSVERALSPRFDVAQRRLSAALGAGRQTAVEEQFARPRHDACGSNA